MHLVRHTFFIILLSCSLNAFTQNFTFVNYSENQGLAAQLVDITQDNNGNLWMVGLLGQFFFHDGVETKSFSFPEHLFTNIIFRIAADANNKIWLLTDRGLISFDGESFEVLNVPSEIQPGYKSQICVDANNRVWILDQNGRIGYTGAQGIRMYDVNDVISDGLVRAMVTDHERNIWLATSTGLLVKINENINTTKLEIKELVNKDIEAVDFLMHELTVVATDSIYRFEDFKLMQKNILSDHKKTERVITDAQSNVWFFESGKLWKVTNGKKLLIDESFGLTDNAIVRIFRDNKNFLWVLTDAKGTFRYSSQPFRQTMINEESIISSILPLDNQGRVLFGTYGKGLFLKEPAVGLKKIVTKTKLDQSIILGLRQTTPDSYWVATHGEGLFRLLTKNNSFQEITAQKPAQPDQVKFIRSMQIFGDSILVGTKAGFFLSVGPTWKPLTGESKLIINCFLRLAPERFLLGSTDGLFLLENSNLVKIDSSIYKSTAINVLKRDGYGNLWVGSNRKDITVYNKDFQRLGKFSIPLPYGGVFLIEFIDHETALIGIGGELATCLRIKFSDDYNIISHTIYGPSHGWPDASLVLGASTPLKNGSLWIGTMSGAFEYKATTEYSDESPPGSYIKKVKLLNSSENIDAYATGKLGFFRLPNDLTLPFNLNSITIGFKANDLSGPRSIQYRFRLTGLESKWSDWTTQDEVIYSNLKPGEYDFEVQAMNDQGIMGKSTLYSFVIRPAFWQTWWFYIIVFILLILVFIGLNRLYYRKKIRDYKKQEDIKRGEVIRIKQQMSMDFHDELGNKLASILSYASALKHSSKNRELDAALEYIETNAQEIYHRTKDFIWAIDVESNNLLQVVIYLRDFGVNFFERNRITFDVKSTFNPETFDLPLPEGYNRQIILIFKEAMTNILKHANCKHVDFFASASSDGRICIIIEDDGKGISSPTGSGSGLRNMKKRAGGINGAFELNKSDLGGLKISLEFKI